MEEGVDNKVNCEICGQSTDYDETKKCVNCWQLESSIDILERRNPKACLTLLETRIRALKKQSKEVKTPIFK